MSSSSSFFVPSARISLIHSRHPSLSFIASGRSTGLHTLGLVSTTVFNIYIYIYIYIYLCHHHHHLVVPSARIYLWPFLATPPYRSSLPVGPQGYTSYPHGVAVWRSELVTHVKGSIGVHHLWKHPYFSSGVLYFWFV